MLLCFYRLLHPALHCQNRCQSIQFMECCSSTIIGVAHTYCSSAKIRRRCPYVLLQRKDPSTAVCLHEANYFLWHLICLPRFRKGSFAPTGDICLYIDNPIFCFHISLNEIHNGQTICQISTSALHGVYTYTLTTHSFAFTLPWMKSITARLSAKFREALPTNNLCTLYTTFQNPLWEPAILNQTVMHNCYKHFWNSWICMHAALFLPASSPCIALSKQVSKHTVYGVLLLKYYWCCL